MSSDRRVLAAAAISRFYIRQSSQRHLQYFAPPLAPPAGGAFSMPSTPLTSRELVDRLDARHEELIARLDELNAQIEAALAEFGRSRETAADDEEERAAA